MLHQHALDRFFREIRIDGLPAKGVEVVEAADERWIPAAFNGFLDRGGQLRMRSEKSPTACSHS